jgi:hypothetical protein
MPHREEGRSYQRPPILLIRWPRTPRRAAARATRLGSSVWVRVRRSTTAVRRLPLSRAQSPRVRSTVSLSLA